MTLIYWEPAREINSLQQEMNRLFSTFFDKRPGSATAGGGRGAGFPPWTSSRRMSDFVLRADLLGISERTSRSRSRTTS